MDSMSSRSSLAYLTFTGYRSLPSIVVVRLSPSNQRAFLLHYAEPISPLLFSGESVDKLLFCAEKGLPSFKKPKSVDFIKPDEMPRTGTGKILHRILRERYQKG